MKNFVCACGQAIYFENTRCNNCAAFLGFDAQTLNMLSFAQHKNNTLVSEQFQFRYCKNYYDYDICNWVLPLNCEQEFCKACELNELIPQVFAPQKRLWWFHLEQAKRRLIYSILSFGLPLNSRFKQQDGLAFAFLEDRRMNPLVEEQIVNTGHAEGLITIYLAEADDIARETARVEMGESYRTLLGHFRHESGHYYFDVLVKNKACYQEFKQLFGDDRRDYQDALSYYYESSPQPGSNNGFISDYAQAHPMEDWAECWAHYFHIMDTLETAAEVGLCECHPAKNSFDECLNAWPVFSEKINSVNRSLGLKDAYPFSISEQTRAKLRFVHSLIDPTKQTTQLVEFA